MMGLSAEVQSGDVWIADRNRFSFVSAIWLSEIIVTFLRAVADVGFCSRSFVSDCRAACCVFVECCFSILARWVHIV